MQIPERRRVLQTQIRDVDCVVYNIGQLATVAAEALDGLGLVKQAALAAQGGRIVRIAVAQHIIEFARYVGRGLIGAGGRGITLRRQHGDHLLVLAAFGMEDQGTIQIERDHRVHCLALTAAGEAIHRNRHQNDDTHRQQLIEGLHVHQRQPIAQGA